MYRTTLHTDMPSVDTANSLCLHARSFYFEISEELTRACTSKQRSDFATTSGHVIVEVLNVLFEKNSTLLNISMFYAIYAVYLVQVTERNFLRRNSLI